MNYKIKFNAMQCWNYNNNCCYIIRRGGGYGRTCKLSQIT